VPVSGGEIAAPPTIIVPQLIVRQIGKLIGAHTAVHGRRQRNAAVLFGALSPDPEVDAYHLRPIIKLWLDNCDWFQEHVHHNRRAETSRNDALEPEFVDHFEQFEGLLHSMVEPFLNIAKSLDEELDKANS
jgi:hypothetical protein